jgi:hypothetical protein
LGVLYLAFGLRALLFRPQAVAGSPPADGFRRLRGVVHVHTVHSDGGGTVEEVARAARRAGLDFVVVTDHENAAAKPREGLLEGVRVLVGSELSTTAGHLLGLGIRAPTFEFSGGALEGLDDVRHLGGFAFAAHPSSPRADLRWTRWELPGPWGVELVNGDTVWRTAGAPRLLRSALLYPFNPAYALLLSLTPQDEALRQWDRLLARRPAPGLGGADAHGRTVVGGLALPVPSYEAAFRLVQDHVLLPPRGDDGRAVVEALAAGRSWVAVEALAPGGGFAFTAEAEGRRATMGDTVAASPGLVLAAGGALPAGARVRLLRDGAEVAAGEGAVALRAPARGVYRVEVRLDGWAAPWLLSNPIYVFDAAEAARREAAAQWPAAEPPPAPALVLDSFDGPTAFHAEHDPSSAMAEAVVAPGAGRDGSAAAVLDFRLGTPGAGRPHVWCALVDRTPRSLAGRQGLVFDLRADGAYRLWVQVRDANPASADEGTEWWFASVRTSPEWQRVGVPFARLRSLNPRSDGRLDLDAVRQLVFVLDEKAVPPGTKGRIWLEGLGAY